jgi:hypothetical protein
VGRAKSNRREDISVGLYPSFASFKIVGLAEKVLNLTEKIKDIMCAVVMEKLWFGDWFLLMQLCKNMNPAIFHDLVIDLRDRSVTRKYRLPRPRH